ncbi:MAG: ABC transporter substrate-binding protein, partial [Planctomycetes bacterium]|nr:ABC transporter substrate-binding protein [Planctomycetota bacterium]
DYFVARDAGAPVAAVPIRLEDGRTICIPNTVAIIRGTKRLPEAQRLVEYLLSAETQLKLARSRARQIPLGAVAPDQLPLEVRELAAWAADGVELTDALVQARRGCLEWLTAESLR